MVALAIQPGSIVNEVFDISPPFPDAPGILAGFLFDDVALSLTEQGPAALESFVLKRWASMMNDPRILTEVSRADMAAEMLDGRAQWLACCGGPAMRATPCTACQLLPAWYPTPGAERQLPLHQLARGAVGRRRM